MCNNICQHEYRQQTTIGRMLNVDLGMRPGGWDRLCWTLVGPSSASAVGAHASPLPSPSPHLHTHSTSSLSRPSLQPAKHLSRRFCPTVVAPIRAHIPVDVLSRSAAGPTHHQLPPDHRSRLTTSHVGQPRTRAPALLVYSPLPSPPPSKLHPQIPLSSQHCAHHRRRNFAQATRNGAHPPIHRHHQTTTRQRPRAATRRRIPHPALQQPI